MAAQIDTGKCTMCGGNIQPLCVEACPDLAIRVQDGRAVVTEFICEDCNECGCVCFRQGLIGSTERWCRRTYAVPYACTTYQL